MGAIPELWRTATVGQDRRDVPTCQGPCECGRDRASAGDTDGKKVDSCTTVSKSDLPSGTGNAWVIHLLAREPEAPPPRYGDLQHYLSSVPGSASASRETSQRDKHCAHCQTARTPSSSTAQTPTWRPGVHTGTGLPG